MVRNLVITGAGFSKDYGLPLDHELLTSIRQNLGSKYNKLLPFLEETAQNYLNIENFFEKSIEEILTRIQFIDLYNPISSTDLTWNEFKIEILNLLSEILRIEKSPQSVYFEFVRLFEKDTAFATLNYDLLLENIFKSLELNYTYLFGENVLRFFKKLACHKNASVNEFLNSQGDSSFPIAYLKLHGSFNWHICWTCNKIYVKDEKSFGVNNLGSSHNQFTQQSQCTECHQNGRGNPGLLPLIIPPTLIKQYEFKFIKHLWDLYYHLVSNVEKIFMIGTSLRNEDLLLINSVSSLNMKNSQLNEFVVINPCDTVLIKTKDLVGLPVRSYKSISEFVTTTREL